jgi:hypothetical protein
MKSTWPADVPVSVEDQVLFVLFTALDEQVETFVFPAMAYP